MRITCQACDTDYIDPSPAAAAEPRPCPWCSQTTAASTNNTSAGGWDMSPEAYQRALDAAASLKPVPRVEVYSAPEFGPGAVAVLVDGKPFCRMTGEEFDEFKRRLPEKPSFTLPYFPMVEEGKR